MLTAGVLLRNTAGPGEEEGARCRNRPGGVHRFYVIH